MNSPAQPDRAADPELAAIVRLLHRRQGWARAAVTGFLAFLLGAGAFSSASSQGTPPPSWFGDIVIGLGALTIACIIAALADTVLLRRRPPQLRAQAGPLAAHHPRRRRAHHYPPRHRLSWAVRWAGMLLILVVAVVSVPAVVDGVAYLAGAEKTVTFDPVAHVTSCAARGGCEQDTDGILQTGGAGTEATWPGVVPVGQPFQVREPAWRWGLGEALINSRWIAVGAICIGLLIEGAAVLVIVSLTRLIRNWLRHRRQPPAAAQVTPA